MIRPFKTGISKVIFIIISIPFNVFFYTFTNKNLLKMKDENGTSQLHYSDKELQDFKLLFEQKLTTAQNEREELRILFESEKDEIIKEQLHQFTNRHIELIEHFKKSLLRIEDKTFGINKKTGELIEKEKLLALPLGGKL